MPTLTQVGLVTIVFVPPMIAGAILGRRLNLSLWRLTISAAFALFVIYLFARPVSALALELVGSTERQHGPFGHTSLYPFIIGACAFLGWWRLTSPRELGTVSSWGVTCGAFAYGLVKARCFFGGCCFGARTFGWWAVRYDADTSAAHILGRNHYVHPEPLYEAVCAILLSVFLAIWIRRARPMQLTAIGTVALCLIRIGLDPLRYDSAPASVILGVRGLNENKAVCGAILALTIALCLVLPKVKARSVAHVSEACAGS